MAIEAGRLGRRRLLASTVAAGALLGGVILGGTVPDAWAQDARKLVIMSHAVHQKVLTGGNAGDITEDWQKEHGVEIEWLTFGVDAVHERGFREATLDDGTAHLIFMLARYGGPQTSNLFVDLDDYQAKDPIAEFDDISASMRAAHTYGDRLVGIPFRHATHGFHYNEALLEERGLDGPPKTFEEFVDYAEKLTYTREDGTQVHGFVTGGTRPTNVMDLIRAHGGDFITQDYEVVIDSHGAAQAIALLQELFENDRLPKSFMTFTTEDPITYMQQGRAAMAMEPFGRNRPFNDPEQSKFPGQIKVTTIPMAESAGGGLVPAKTSVWAMAIPENSPDAELAWSFIRHVSAPENTIRAAINGNGPVRPSAYDDPRVQELVSYAQDEQQVLSIAKLPMPGFDNAARVRDIFIEEVQSAVLGRKSAEESVASIQERVAPLLPTP